MTGSTRASPPTCAGAPDGRPSSRRLMSWPTTARCRRPALVAATWWPRPRGLRSRAASLSGWDRRSCSGTAASPTTPARRMHWWRCRTDAAGTWWATLWPRCDVRPARSKAAMSQVRWPTRLPCPMAGGTSPCRPPGWSPAISRPTRRGADPGGSQPRPAPTGERSAASSDHRSGRSPVGWPTSTGARSASSGRERTPCASARSVPPSASASTRRVKGSCGWR